MTVFYLSDIAAASDVISEFVYVNYLCCYQIFINDFVLPIIKTLGLFIFVLRCCLVLWGQFFRY